MKNIIQIPLGLSKDDLPIKIELNKKFTVNGITYICEYGDPSCSYICSTSDKIETDIPEQIDNYYIIRKF